MKAAWESKRLGEIAVISSGKSNTSDAVIDGDFAFFDRSKTIKRSNKFLFDCPALIIPGEGKEFRPKPYDGKFDLHQRAYAIYDFHESVLRDFIFYAMEYNHKYFQDNAVGATVKSLRQRHFDNFPILLPPLEEQRRIVAVLDEAFDGLNRARENIETNLTNARELFNEVEAKCFSDISTGSKSRTLGQLASFRNGLNYSRASRGAEIKIVGVGDFQNNLFVPEENLSHKIIDGELDERDKLIAGDILAVRSNGNRDLIGRTMLMPETNESISFSGFTIRIRLECENLLPEYVCSYLRTKSARTQLTAGGGGASISNLNQRILSSFPITFPELATQQNVLDRLGSLREYVAGLREGYEIKLTNLEDLRQSLLQKAFAGELT